MKKIYILLASILFGNILLAQNYPEPEFSNEVYYLNKNDNNKLVRLEKESSKMNTTQGTFKGSEVSYSLDGTRSPVRLAGGKNLSFVISTGSSGSSSGMTSKSDSAMTANGVDPNILSGIMSQMNDPSKSFTLYEVDISKGERKIILQKTPGINPFGKHQIQSSDKYTFSAKKIKDGYWEFIIDKSLPKGEYAFFMTSMGMGGMGDAIIFAFGVD
jgi:hypothetical protein